MAHPDDDYTKSLKAQEANARLYAENMSNKEAAERKLQEAENLKLAQEEYKRDQAEKAQKEKEKKEED